MTGWMTCVEADALALNSGESLATSYVDGAALSVNAWVNNTRYDDAADRKINIAVSYYLANVLPLPTTLSVRSVVGPGLACKQNFSGVYDCVVLYVDTNDAQNKVFAQRLSIGSDTTHYTITEDPSGPYLVQDSTTGYTAQTGSRIAATFNGSNGISVVIRSAQSDQPLELFTSTNGTSWTKRTQSLPYSAVGPSFASPWNDQATNYLVYAR
jgi:hypothetical protein